jgi:tetratricopeptide (TPR) repeat protein
MSRLRGFLGAALAAALSLTSVGCMRKVLLDGQIKGTLDGSEAVNTLHDFEVARAVARAGLAQLEGLHKLAPYNENALFMLTRTWAGASSAFTEDDWEMAVEKNDTRMAEYHLLRARAGYTRARFYGIELLTKRASGFEQARRNANSMRAWLRENFTHVDEAEDLLWIGFAWVGHVGVSKDVPEAVGDLYVGVEILQRSLELNNTLEYGMGHTIMGAYHARTALAELDESKRHFDEAMKINEGKYLLTQLNYATRYYCFKSDKPNYEKMLKAVLAAGDTLPEARLQNVVAKRKARRYLEHSVFAEDCGFNQ